MAYTTRADLSFCRVDGHFVFLDIESDRYFALPAGLERAYASFLADGTCAEPDLRRLVQLGILTPGAGPVHRTSTTVEAARHSALERFAETSPLRLRDLLEVATIVLSTRLRLAACPLKAILGRLCADRSACAGRPSADRQRARRDLASAVATFRRARAYVPVSTRCLLDSISIVRFLARRGLTASIVFGVTRAPFSAHCWAQSEALMLNDSVGNVTAYTPIHVT